MIFLLAYFKCIIKQNGERKVKIAIVYDENTDWLSINKRIAILFIVKTMSYRFS